MNSDAIMLNPVSTLAPYRRIRVLVYALHVY